MDKIKQIGGEVIENVKNWYLLQWAINKKIMVVVHIFVAVVLLSEILV
jgi:hypothetical protein